MAAGSAAEAALQAAMNIQAIKVCFMSFSKKKKSRCSAKSIC
jgi:hypothetical protein